MRFGAKKIKLKTGYRYFLYQHAEGLPVGMVSFLGSWNSTQCDPTPIWVCGPPLPTPFSRAKSQNTHPLVDINTHNGVRALPNSVCAHHIAPPPTNDQPTTERQTGPFPSSTTGPLPKLTSHDSHPVTISPRVFSTPTAI